MYICNENVKILNDLPTKKYGDKMRVDNKAMAGMVLDIEYWGKDYEEIKVIEYIKGNRTKFKVRYNEKEFNISCGDFLKGHFGNILGLKTGEFKVEMGQVFKDGKRDLVIMNREYRKDKRGRNWKYYKYKCNKPDCGGNEDWINESNLLGGIGCNACSNKKATAFNCMYTTAPWMIKLGVSEEDAKKYTRSSNEKVNVKCPDCGREKNKKIIYIYEKKSIGCTCGDGKSYPEKFIVSLLNQLNSDYVNEYSPSWVTDDKRYDFYIEDFNMIIEVHGEQHYKESGWGKSIKEEQENDTYKRELALDNGVENYITLDCRESDLEYIKNSILESKLKDILDLSKIDWLKCEEFALKNVVKEVCEYWNNREEWETTTDLGKVFRLNRNTISAYLKKGVKLGWCDYDVKEESRKGRSKSGKLKGKKIEMFKDGLSLGVFDSCHELSRKSEELFGVKLLQSNISAVCRGIQAHHKGYTFRYI